MIQFTYTFLLTRSSPYGVSDFIAKNVLELCIWFVSIRLQTEAPISCPHFSVIDEALDQVSGSVIFSQYDRILAYNQNRIFKMDNYKPVFRIFFGSFGWEALCLCFTKALALSAKRINSMRWIKLQKVERVSKWYFYLLEVNWKT